MLLPGDPRFGELILLLGKGEWIWLDRNVTGMIWKYVNITCMKLNHLLVFSIRINSSVTCSKNLKSNFILHSCTLGTHFLKSVLLPFSLSAPALPPSQIHTHPTADDHGLIIPLSRLPKLSYYNFLFTFPFISHIYFILSMPFPR